MNYGETLAYWYLRLNGFFPLRNFVMHMPDDRLQRSDCDIVAVRFPGVSEDIGGQRDDWDKPRFERWGLSLDVPLALVVQVKTGTEGEPGKAFSEERLKEAVRRVGLWDREASDRVARDLGSKRLLGTDRATVAKLLIASQPAGPAKGDTHLTMKIDEATGFIRERLKKYAAQKVKDRLFFNDELMQFLAHEAGLPIETVE